MNLSLNYQKKQIVNLNRYYEKLRVCVASFIYVVNLQTPNEINPFISLKCLNKLHREPFLFEDMLPVD